MQDAYIPKISFGGGSSPLQPLSMGAANMIGSISKTNAAHGPSFQSVMNDLFKNVNETTSAPDKLMQQALMGGDVDVHDVMLANAKAELTVTVAAQMTTKVIQAYDRILQIQV